MSKIPEVLSLKQITEMYDVSYSLISKATANREFPFYRRSKNKNKGMGKIYVKKSDFEKWLLFDRYDSKANTENQSLTA